MAVPVWSAVGAPVPIESGSWTLAILPDTQFYAQTYPAIFAAQTQFLADYKDALNIKMVQHEGDITNTNAAAEWVVASNAFATLENAGVQYGVAQGNHDINSVRASLFPTYFPVSRLAAQSTFGAEFPEPDPNNPSVNLPNNSYSLFSAGGTDWISFELEFGPRDQVIDWVDATLKAFPDRQAIITTHAYMYFDNTRYDWAAKGTAQNWSPYTHGVASLPGGVNDGEDIWQKLKDNANLSIVLNGHVLGDGTGYLASVADNGNIVHQMLANYQFLANGGQGYLRLLEFKAGGDTVEIRTYSPWLDAQASPPMPANRTDPDQRFTISLSSLPPPPPTLFRAVAANMVATGPTIPAGNTVDFVYVTQSGTPPIGTSQLNKGDYQPNIYGNGFTYTDGIMLASITQNLRDGVRATVEAGRDPYGDGFMSLSIAQAGMSSNTEVNMNVSMAWFAFEGGWRGAHVTSGGTLAAANGVAQAMLIKTGVGRYTLDLDADSRTDGLLFAIGNNNSNRIVNTGVLADGSGWDLRIQNNTATFAATGTDSTADFSFLYIPMDAENLIGGRYDGIANTSLSAVGDFTMERLATGQYRLTIPGQSPDTGMLIVSTSYETTASGITAPDDNILTYESDGMGHFLINSLDLSGGTALSLQNSQFVWAFISFDNPVTMEQPPIPGDVNFDGQVRHLRRELCLDELGRIGARGGRQFRRNRRYLRHQRH